MFPSLSCLQTLYHSPFFFSVLFLAAPRIPCALFVIFSHPPLLFGSAAALEDAWHLSIVCIQDRTKWKWVQRRAERQMSKKGNE